MLYRNMRVSVTFMFVFISLMAAATANALMLDCAITQGADLLPGTECASAQGTVDKASAYAVKDGVPSESRATPQATFLIGQPHHSGAPSNSAPLLILIGALLTFLFVRAKRFNTK